MNMCNWWQEKFLAEGDPIKAEQQRAYMRHQFDYYGLTAPKWLGMLKTIFLEHGTFTGNKLKAFVELCYHRTIGRCIIPARR
jgi:hypothetical protein